MGHVVWGGGPVLTRGVGNWDHPTPHSGLPLVGGSAPYSKYPKNVVNKMFLTLRALYLPKLFLHRRLGALFLLYPELCCCSISTMPIPSCFCRPISNIHLLLLLSWNITYNKIWAIYSLTGCMNNDDRAMQEL